MGNPGYFIFWLVILILFSFILAYLACFFYIWAYIFSQCCDCSNGVADFFLKGVQFPGYCAKSMMNCRKPC